MKSLFNTSTLLLGLALPLVLTACPGGNDDDDEVGDTTDDTTSADTSTTNGTTTADDTTSADTTVDTTDSTDSTTGDPPDPFIFANDPPEAYMRVDRMGMPAVATAVITSKDEYNAADPSDDVGMAFVGEIVANVTALHLALDDDLMALNLTPCGGATCVAQAGPLVVPDTLKIDLSSDPGFPNGRTLPDQVIDITFAVVMLDLGVMGQDPFLFAGLPLNPAANDLPFLAEFPYLADPH